MAPLAMMVSLRPWNLGAEPRKARRPAPGRVSRLSCKLTLPAAVALAGGLYWLLRMVC